RAEWAPETFLDPTTKALGSRVIADRTLTVVRSEGAIAVRDGMTGLATLLPDTLEPKLTGRDSEPVPSELLTSSGIMHVLVWKGSPGFVPALPGGWMVTFSGSDFEVWSVDGSAVG